MAATTGGKDYEEATTLPEMEIITGPANFSYNKTVVHGGREPEESIKRRLGKVLRESRLMSASCGE
jgi:hypothetical protein